MPKGQLTVTIALRHSWLLLIPIGVQYVGLLIASAGARLLSWMVGRLLVIVREGKPHV